MRAKLFNKLLTGVSMFAGLGGSANGAPMTDAERAKFSTQVVKTLEFRVDNLEVENTGLQQELQEMNAIIGEMETQLPSEIKRPPLLGADGKITDSGKQWLREIFPREIDEISQEITKLKAQHGSEVAEQIQDILHKTLLILAFLTLLVTAGISGYMLIKGISAYKKVECLCNRILPPRLRKMLGGIFGGIWKKYFKNRKKVTDENWGKIQGAKIDDKIMLTGKGGSEEITITDIVDDMVIGTSEKGVKMIFTPEKFSYEFSWTDDLKVENLI